MERAGDGGHAAATDGAQPQPRQHHAVSTPSRPAPIPNRSNKPASPQAMPRTSLSLDAGAPIVSMTAPLPFRIHPGSTLVGRRVVVWWEFQRRAYAGTVTQYDKTDDTIKVEYDAKDHEPRWHPVKHFPLVLAEDAQGPPPSAPRVATATSAPAPQHDVTTSTTASARKMTAMPFGHNPPASVGHRLSGGTARLVHHRNSAAAASKTPPQARRNTIGTTAARRLVPRLVDAERRMSPWKGTGTDRSHSAPVSRHVSPASSPGPHPRSPLAFGLHSPPSLRRNTMPAAAALAVSLHEANRLATTSGSTAAAAAVAASPPQYRRFHGGGGGAAAAANTTGSDRWGSGRPHLYPHHAHDTARGSKGSAHGREGGNGGGGGAEVTAEGVTPTAMVADTTASPGKARSSLHHTAPDTESDGDTETDEEVGTLHYEADRRVS
eukprot:m.57469 g.57469  ORF g.57469 m.57469 type:complete len:436 (+) comp7761_c0_seq2:208-1515(+)